jgi:hypothetical protein
MASLGREWSAFDRHLNTLLTRNRRLFQEALMTPAATDDDRNELSAATIM